MNPYETDLLLHQYLLFHYGSDEEILPHPSGPRGALGFAVRSVTELLDATSLPPKARALDLGCAVGRSAFELARFADEVTGLDYSQAFVQAAHQLAAGAILPYQRQEEGTHFTPLKASVPPDLPRNRVHFVQGDAQALPADWHGFDLVHAANLLCRLPEPARLLARLPELVKPGGQLLLATPCSWLPEYTPPPNWPEGRTLEFLHQHLDASFTCEVETDLPFLIREHARKFQWSVALGTRWRRR